jgi:L-fuculose-phosphate aldolase
LLDSGGRDRIFCLVSEAEARQAIVDVCRRLHERGLFAAADGDVSVRLGPARLLVTPAAMRGGRLAPADLVVTDLAGLSVSGGGQPAAGIRLHVLVYAERPDVQAVVHAHPPMATALAGEPAATSALPDEAVATIQALVRLSNAIVVDHHGALAVGGSLDEACARLEALEASARLPPGCVGCAGCPAAG